MEFFGILVGICGAISIIATVWYKYYNSILSGRASAASNVLADSPSIHANKEYSVQANTSTFSIWR